MLTLPQKGKHLVGEAPLRPILLEEGFAAAQSDNEKALDRFHIHTFISMIYNVVSTDVAGVAVIGYTGDKMNKWVLLTAITVSLFVVSCRQAGWTQAISNAPTPEAQQTMAPAPINTPVPLPTASPSPQPKPTQAAPEPPAQTSAKGLERQFGQEKRTLPPVSAVEVGGGNAKRQEIALTFDAGASSAPTPRILETLARNKVPATMFLTGQWAEANPELVKQIVALGHEVANHSYTHPEFTKLTADQMKDEMAKTEAIVQKITGQSTKPFFRPPFGDRDARVREVVSKEGYFTVYWTLDSTDWRPEATAVTVRDRVLQLASSGSIIVFHLGSEATAQSLEEIIVRLREKGFSLVNLSWILSN